MISKETIKAAIYARVPNYHQPLVPVNAQLADCTAYCEQHGYVVTGSYVDEAIGSYPQYAQLLADVKAGKFDCIVVRDVSNLVIDEVSYYEFKQTLSKLGIALHFVACNYDDSPEGCLTESTKVSIVARNYDDSPEAHLMANIVDRDYGDSPEGHLMESMMSHINAYYNRKGE